MRTSCYTTIDGTPVYRDRSGRYTQEPKEAAREAPQKPVRAMRLLGLEHCTHRLGVNLGERW